MKKTILFTLLLTAIAVQTYAQTVKRDTVVLSVYNNNQRFMLYPMPFGKDKPDIDFTATMLVSLDTILMSVRGKTVHIMYGCTEDISKT